MSKKIILILVLLLILILCSCSSDQGSKKTEKTELTTSEAQKYTEYLSVEENLNVYTIKTPYCSLSYPTRWKKYIKVNKIKNKNKYVVTFVGKIEQEEVKLFDVVFGNKGKNNLGYYKDSNKKIFVSVKTYDLKDCKIKNNNVKQTFITMQEDINTIIENLYKDKDFVTK